MPTDAELGWAAGFIDADGSLMICKSKKAGHLRGYHFYPAITAVGVDRSALDRLAEILGGGCFYKGSNREDRANIKRTLQAYYWSTTAQASLRAAKLIQPHLVIKKRQAEIIIEFYEGRLWTRGGSVTGKQGGGKPMSDEEHDRREKLWTEIKGLNARNYLERLPLAAA